MYDEFGKEYIVKKLLSVVDLDLLMSLSLIIDKNDAEARYLINFLPLLVNRIVTGKASNSEDINNEFNKIPNQLADLYNIVQNNFKEYNQEIEEFLKNEEPTLRQIQEEQLEKEISYNAFLDEIVTKKLTKDKEAADRRKDLKRRVERSYSDGSKEGNLAKEIMADLGMDNLLDDTDEFYDSMLKAFKDLKQFRIDQKNKDEENKDFEEDIT